MVGLVSQNYIIIAVTMVTNHYRVMLGVFLIIGITICCCCFFCLRKYGCPTGTHKNHFSFNRTPVIVQTVKTVPAAATTYPTGQGVVPMNTKTYNQPSTYSNTLTDPPPPYP